MKDPSKPRVSVVAPTYRRRAGLPRLVEPLLSDPELHELVVAVDGSVDGSVEWLLERGRSDCRLVTLDLPNRGCGAARQAGIEAATGEVVVLLDDDVIAGPGLIAGHRAHHRDLAPKLVLGYMPNDWSRLPPGRRGIGYIYRRAYEKRCQRFAREPAFVLNGLWGGNFSMPRRDFLRIGIKGLDVPRGADDRDFGLRCATGGIAGMFDRSLFGEHMYERTIEQWRSDCRLLGESRRLLHNAHTALLGEELADERTVEHVIDAVGMGLPRWLRAAWTRLAEDPVFGPFTVTCEAAFRLGVSLQHLGLEVQAARAIGSIETMRGVLVRS